MSFVTDVGEQDFEQQVLARSRTVPVVVDFWAAWCAPCRMLGPTLEREVNALGGRVELAKVDVDQAQALSGRFGVQGIPAVMAFRDGQVVADFVGAKDAAFVRRWLASLAPSASGQALAAAKDEPGLRALLGDAEVGHKAALRLAELLLSTGKAAEALAVLERLPAGSAEAEAGEALKRLAGFAVDAEQFGGEARAREVLARQPDDRDAQWALGCALAARGEAGPALESFLSLVTASRKYRDDGARKAMVALFERLGPQHELTREFRRRLQNVL
ncbi:MAG: tetratricopeptide repeat protein [Archangium sp.]|nr:tetratricopeptide repeat protein [Archangium sp.]